MTNNDTSATTETPQVIHMDADTVGAMMRAGEPLPLATIVIDRPIRL